jgi:hypothetical protein
MWKATGGYWATGVEENPLLHTWSLAVEEQFYLVFPLTLVIIFKWKRHLLFPILAALAAFSFAGCVLGTSLKPSASFYLLPTRAWELLVGSLLAIYPPALRGQLAKHRWAGILAGSGLVMIGISYLVLQGGHGFPGYKAALPTVGALLVIAFTNGENGIVARVLQARWMIFIGKISYSLYLWHWPVIVFFRGMQDNPTFPALLPMEATGAACVLFSFLLTLASYWWIERPLRAWRGTPVFCAVLFVGMVAAMEWLKPGNLARRQEGTDLTAGFAPMEVRGRLYAVNQKNEFSASAREKYKHVRFLFPEKPSKLEAGIMRTYGTNQTEDVMVMGDSHSMMFAPMVDDILRAHKLTGCFFCADGIDPVLFRTHYDADESFGSADDCRLYDNARKRMLDSHRPKVVLWIERYDECQFEHIHESIQYCTEHSKCVFFQQAPVLNIGDLCTVDVFGYFRNVAHKQLNQLNIVERRPTRIHQAKFEEELLNCFRRNEQFVWFDTSKELLSSNGRIRWWDGVDQLYYVDDDHLSEYGVHLFRPRLEKVIVDAMASLHQ